MFTHCPISEIPDISKWDVSNILNMSYMFSGCIKLTAFPNIFNWEIKNHANMRGIFYNCINYKHGLEKYDDSKCKINNQSDISFIFYYCLDLHAKIEYEEEYHEILERISNKFKIGLKYLDAWNISGHYNYY